MSKQTEIIMQQIQALVQDGKIIQAIKLARMAKGMDLKSAKNFIDEFRGQIDVAKRERHTQREQGFEPLIYGQRSLDHDPKYQTNYKHSHQHSLEKDLPTEVYLHLQKGEKIQAIKRLRELKGMSLNEANSLVGRFYTQNPQYEMQEDKKSQSVIPLLIFAGVTLYIISRLFA